MPDTDTAQSRENRTIVLLNPGAGRARSDEERAELMDRLEALEGVDLRILDRKTPVADAARQALDEGYGTIVAAGGDGTISAVAGVLAGSGRRMGLLPLGTFNFLARALDMPLEEADAIDTLTGGTVTPVSVGEVNGHVFVNNASLGAYAAVLEARERIYGRWGRSRFAAYWSVIVALANLTRSLKMEITVDGKTERMRTPLAFVAIRPFQLDTYDLSGAEEVRDGKMALYLAPESGRLTLIWRALKILLRQTQPGRDYHVRTGREIIIRPDRSRMTLARDGERDEVNAPFHFKACPGALSVLTPAPAEVRERTA